MKTHLTDSKERKHYIVSKPLLPDLKTQAIYTGTFTTKNTERPKPHKHNFYEVLFVVGGSGTVYIDDRTCSVAKGDIVLYRPLQKHCEIALSGQSLICFFFAVHKTVALQEILEQTKLPEVLSVRNKYRQFYFLFDMLISETKNKDIRFFNELSNSLCETVLLKILQLSTIITLPQKTNDTFECIKGYIDEHFTEKFRFDEICEQLHISKFYISRLFKEYTNVSPTRYLMEKRMEYAKKLLTESDMTLEEIASAIGYSDPYHFSRLFKREVGVSTKNYWKGNFESTIEAPVLPAGDSEAQ